MKTERLRVEDANCITISRFWDFDNKSLSENEMRGKVIDIEDADCRDHLLRPIKAAVDDDLPPQFAPR